MKKLLALVLALVMTLGLATVGTNAALSDFKDADSITNEEAMGVMNAVGVFEGSDGVLNPTGKLTRAEASKLVAYLALGKSVADALPKTGSQFADVANNQWYTGYVNYMVNAKYTSGISATQFGPAGALTGYQFGAFLLAALGYDRQNEGMIGDGWETKVAVMLERLGLTENIKALGSENITREEAAQMCLNALKADVVEYETTGSTINLPGGISLSTNPSKATAVKDTKYDAGKEKASGLTDGTLQLAEKLYGGKLVLDSTVADGTYGRPVDHEWVYDKDTKITVDETAVKTYTEEVKGGTLYTDLGKVEGKDLTITAYEDGKKVTDDKALKDLSDAIVSGNKTSFGGNGIQIEIYKTADKTYTVCVINTYVGQVATHKAAKGSAKEYITITNLSKDDPKAANSGKFETTAFTDDDATDGTVVLYTVNDGKVASAKAASSAELVATRLTGTTSFVAGGTTYKYSDQAAEDAKLKNADVTSSGVKKDVYFDDYGFVIYTKTASEAESAAQYAVLLDLGTRSVDSFSTANVAKLLLADGNVEVVEITNDWTKGTYVDFTANKERLNVVSYTVNSKGQYTLKDANAAVDQGTNDKAFVLTSGKAAGTAQIGGKTTSVYFNSKTVFFVVTSKDGKLDTTKVYTGIANVPSLTNGSAKDALRTYVAVTAEKNIAKTVLILNAKAGSASSTSKDASFILGDATVGSTFDADLGEFYTYQAVVKGDITTVNTADKMTEGKLYSSVTKNDKDIVTAVGDVVATTFTGTTKAADEVIGLGSGFFSYSSDIAVYTIDGDEISKGGVAALATDANDTGWYTLNDDGAVNAIYVVKVAD